jgi:plastocyanin
MIAGVSDSPSTPGRPSAVPVALAALAVAATALALGVRRVDPRPPEATPPVTDRSPEAAVAVVVTMTVDRFVPERVTVRAGGTVEWKNTNSVWHTVTADPEYAAMKTNVVLPEGAERFHSGEVWPGDVYRRTFTVPGTYKYFCQPHEAHGMIGWVEVVR